MYTTFSTVITIITVDIDHFTVYTLTSQDDQTDQHIDDYHHTMYNTISYVRIYIHTLPVVHAIIYVLSVLLWVNILLAMYIRV